MKTFFLLATELCPQCHLSVFLHFKSISFWPIVGIPVADTLILHSIISKSDEGNRNSTAASSSETAFLFSVFLFGGEVPSL